ncbi:MAG: hypothetical protein N2449_01535 [Bacteroidales bacterium]|nr:hypothetical protein [Bacteroidales bacterium]
MNRYFFTLFVFCISNFTFIHAQLKINWNSNEYLFYQTKKIKELPFTFENANDDIVKVMNNLSNVGKLKKIKIPKNYNSCQLQGKFIFKETPNETDFRMILEHLNIHEFYVNDIKILTRTLISEKDAKDKAIAFEYKDMIFQSYFNDTSRIEYYDFQIYYAQTKLIYMYSQNYPKYLYQGYVTKFTEMLETKTKEREAFLQKTKN